MLRRQPPLVPEARSHTDMATLATQQTDTQVKEFSVLLVEDDMCTRTLVASLLTKCSYKGALLGVPGACPETPYTRAITMNNSRLCTSRVDRLAAAPRCMLATSPMCPTLSVHVASNGREALDVLNSGTTPVDLILTDILMPEVSGMHLMAELAANESLRTIPVVGMRGVAGARHPTWSPKTQ